MLTIGVINGPNLDRLGQREPHIYGNTTLSELEAGLIALSDELDCNITCFQSNHEGDIIDRINLWAQTHAGLIINPAAYSHTSIAIRDAIAGANIPTIEVHISNVHAREDFRQKLITGGACEAVISGMGLPGYFYALRFLSSKLHQALSPTEFLESKKEDMQGNASSHSGS